MKKIVFLAVTLTLLSLAGVAAAGELPDADLAAGGQKAFMFSDVIGDYSIELVEILPAEGDGWAVENGKFLFKGLFTNMRYSTGEKVTVSPRLFLLFYNIESGSKGEWVESPRYSKNKTDCTVVDSTSQQNMKDFECPFYLPTDGIFKQLKVEVIVAAVNIKESADTELIFSTYKHSPSFFITFDYDTDGILDENDNCLKAPNSDQADADKDGIGDACAEAKKPEEPVDPCIEDPAAEGCAAVDEPTGDENAGGEDEPALDDSSADSPAKEDITSCSFVPNVVGDPSSLIIIALPALLLAIRRRR